jgi:hypothetical protein
VNRWERAAGQVVRVVIIATGVLLLLGMVLSYAGLRAFFLGAGLPGWAASLSPLCVDVLALVAYVALVVLVGKAYPAAVVALTVLGSAAAQGYHLSHGGVAADITDGRVIFAAGASAMVCAGLAGHLLYLVLARALPAEFITALQADLAPAVHGSTEPVSDLTPRRDDPFSDELDQADPTSTAQMGSVTDAELEELLAEPVLTAPAAIHRPVARRPIRVRAGTVRPSQQTGPCVPTCKHHTGNVSKSTRYRCEPGGACKQCNPN